jgi:DeoR family glycerol-3-phosphate regulon repressor
VVTPSLSVGAILAAGASGAVHVTGGLIQGPDGSLVGEDATAAIARFRLDWALIASSGFDPDGSAMDFDALKVGVKRAMIARARRAMLIADASKFARTAPVCIAAPDEIGVLVTDAEPPEALGSILAENGCRVVVADQDRPG